MLPAEDIILACQHCKGWMRKPTLLSGNTFGGRLWSDSKREYPMLPDTPELVRCPHCKAMIWIRNTVVVRSAGQEIKARHKFEKILKGESIEEPLITWPEPHDYREALENRMHCHDRDEQYIRMHLWWKLNDPVRNGEKHETDPEMLHLFTDDLYGLLRLYESEKEKNILLIAEIYRELGEFKKAKELLSELKDENFKHFGDLMRSKIIGKDSKVFLLA